MAFDAMMFVRNGILAALKKKIDMDRREEEVATGKLEAAKRKWECVLSRCCIQFCFFSVPWFCFPFTEGTICHRNFTVAVETKPWATREVQGFEPCTLTTTNGPRSIVHSTQCDRGPFTERRRDVNYARRNKSHFKMGDDPFFLELASIPARVLSCNTLEEGRRSVFCWKNRF